MTFIPKTRLPARPRLKASVLAAWLGALLIANPAGAQWAVIDGAANVIAESGIAKAAAEYAEQAARWAETVEHYAQQVAHYQQMVASVANLNFSGMSMSNQLTPITDTSGFVAQACPGSGSVVGSVLGALGLSALSLGGNIAQNQQVICQKITLLQIDKFNKTADMLNQMNRYSALFQQIDQLRNALSPASSIGDLQANTNEVERNSLKLTGDVENWRGQMMANDIAIRTLQDQQSILATIALKGKSSPIGSIVQAGAFAAAFD